MLKKPKKFEHIPECFGIKEGAEDFPLMCVLSFIYVCNASCPNCPYNNSSIRDKYKDALIMPVKLFKRIATECGRYGSYLRISGGGEPMMHPQAVELFLYAKKKNAKIGLITNGSIFTVAKLEKLISAQIDVIEFSVDAADEDTYNKVRPGLSWSKLNENVANAVKIRDALKSNTKIIASAIDQKDVNIQDIKDYWEDRVDNLQIRKYLTWGYNKDNSGDSAPYLDTNDKIPCPWLFERLNIDSRGAVTLCGEDIAFDCAFANVNDKSIKDIWKSPEFEKFRRLHLEKRGDEIEICSTCPDWQYRSWKYNYWKLINE